jgi:hypothetical protein
MEERRGQAAPLARRQTWPGGHLSRAATLGGRRPLWPPGLYPALLCFSVNLHEFSWPSLTEEKRKRREKWLLGHLPVFERRRKKYFFGFFKVLQFFCLVFILQTRRKIYTIFFGF